MKGFILFTLGFIISIPVFRVLAQVDVLNESISQEYKTFEDKSPYSKDKPALTFFSEDIYNQVLADNNNTDKILSKLDEIIASLHKLEYYADN